MKDSSDVAFRESAPGQDGFQLLKICDRIDVAGRLLTSESSVEIAPNANVVRIASQLADMVHMIDDVLQHDAG